MITKFSKGIVALTAIVAAAALTLVGPAKAQVAAGFENNGTSDTAFTWNVDTGVTVKTSNNGSGGTNVAMFGISSDASHVVGVADDSGGIFHGAGWNGVAGAATTPAGGYFDSGAAQGFAGNDTPWSINKAGVAVGQGVGQIAGYDQGFFASIEWAAGGASVTDLNTLNNPSGGGQINGTGFYPTGLYIEGYDISGLGCSADGINDNGDTSGVSFQWNAGAGGYYQAVVGHNGAAYVSPYFDSSDPSETSWNISTSSATCGYGFINALTVAVGYTATVNTASYSFGASGGAGTINNYGQGPANSFQWFIDNNDSGNGQGQAVGFDIDPTGTFNQAVYDKNDATSVAVASTAGGTTTVLVGVANDGSSAGFQTIAADAGADFHAFGTQTGTPGATVAYTEATGVIGSKAFEITSGGGASGPGVKTFTGAAKKKGSGFTYKALAAKHSKPSKVSVILTGPAGAGGQVVAVTSSNTGALNSFTITVPAGQTTVNNFKTAKFSKTSKGQSITLTASANGGSQSQTATIK